MGDSDAVVVKGNVGGHRKAWEAAQTRAVTILALSAYSAITLPPVFVNLSSRAGSLVTCLTRHIPQDDEGIRFPVVELSGSAYAKLSFPLESPFPYLVFHLKVRSATT